MIDDNIIAFGCMPDLLAGSFNPLFYDFWGVLSPFVQPFFQCGNRWRQNENADRFGKKPADLPRALPVDFQQGVVSGIQLIHNGYS